jgi:hypothetical protein
VGREAPDASIVGPRSQARDQVDHQLGTSADEFVLVPRRISVELLHRQLYLVLAVHEPHPDTMPDGVPTFNSVAAQIQY